jgi:hypothetical protein
MTENAKKPRWQKILDLEAQANGRAPPVFQPPPAFDPTPLLPEQKGSQRVRRAAGILLFGIGIALALPSLAALWLAVKIFSR